MIDYPNKLNIIFDKLEYLRIKPIIIGGYIRDKLLKIDSKDIDIELYGIDSLDKLQKILEEFGSVNSVGKSFGVCKLKFQGLDIDFSLPRVDSKIASGHRGFDIQVDTSLDFKTATSRRDFTINAIGYDVQRKTLLDPFNGLMDLEKKVLRAVDIKKFSQDPLRVLRAVQFSSRFNFELETSLFNECQRVVNAGILKELAQERVSEELLKLLLKSPKPSLGFKLLATLEIYKYFNESSILDRVDFFAKSKMQDKKSNILIFYALLYSSQTQEYIHELLDEKSLLKEMYAFLECFKIFPLNSFKNYDLYLLATKVNIEKFSHFLDAYHLGEKSIEIHKMLKDANRLGITHKKARAFLQGRDLINAGLKPSSVFSKILNDAYEAQINSEIMSHNDALVWLKKWLHLG